MSRKKLEEIRSLLHNKKLFVVPYTHADWAWCHTRAWHAKRYLAAFEDVIDLLNKDIGYKWYMDCFSTEFMPVLDFKPSLVPELRKQIGLGNIEIAGGFSNVRPNMVGDEAYIRNMIIGRKRFLEVFPDAEIKVQAEAVDVALGHPQIPQLLLKGGFRYYRAGRPYEVLRKKGIDRSFFWEGLDGSRVLVWWGEYGGMYLPEEVQKLRDKLDSWDDLVTTLYQTELIKYDLSSEVSVVWVAQGSDDALPLKAFNSDLDVPLPEIIEKWNKAESSEMRFALPIDFFRELEKHGKDIMTYKGTVDICDVCYNVAWGGEQGLVNRRLKSSEQICEAETWSLLATSHGFQANTDFQGLWESSLTASAHATAWLYTSDYKEISALIDKALVDAYTVKKTALHHITRLIRKPQDTLAVVFNSLERDRQEVVSLTLLAGDLEGLSFQDGDGQTLPFQVIQPYEYTDSVWEHEVLVKVGVPALGYTVIRAQGVDTDCRLGGQYVKPVAPLPFGVIKPFSMDNGILRLDFENGRLISIFDYTIDSPLPKQGDRAYNDLGFTCIESQGGVLHAGPKLYEVAVQFMTATILEEGPVRWRVQLEGSDGRITYIQEISLEAGKREIQFKVHVDWPKSEGYLTCSIPTGADCILRGGIPFGSEHKDVDAEPYKSDEWDDMHRQWEGLFCAKDYVRAIDGKHAVSLISIDGDRFYFFDRKKNSLSYVLINSTRLTPDSWEDNVGRETIESIGLHEFNYALRIGDSSESDLVTFDTARRMRMPVTSVDPLASAIDGPLPARMSFAKISGENVCLSAFYREGNQCIIRIYEYCGETADTEIEFPLPVLSCQSENFIGESDKRPLKVDDSSVSLQLRPHEIVTLRVGFGNDK